jgi:hypothetical protein
MTQHIEEKELQKRVIQSLSIWLAGAVFFILSLFYIGVKVYAVKAWPSTATTTELTFPEQMWKTFVSDYLPDALFVSLIAAIAIYIVSYLALRNFQRLNVQYELRPIYAAIADELANKIIEKTHSPSIDGKPENLVSGNRPTFKLLSKLIEAAPADTVMATDLPPLVEQGSINTLEYKDLSDLLLRRSAPPSPVPHSRRKK